MRTRIFYLVLFHIYLIQFRIRLERWRRFERGIGRCRSRPIIVGDCPQRLITKPEKTNAPSSRHCGALEAEMKQLKNSSHAAIMPHVVVKIKLSVQVIAHKLIYGFVLILWLLMAAWPS